MLELMTDATTLIRVQSWDRASGVPGFLEIDCPAKVGSVASGPHGAVICTGPTDWLIVARPGPGLAQALNEQFRGTTSFRATDLSAALGRIRIEGAYARALLSKACALDVHSGELHPDRAPRTLVAGLPVIVRCVADSGFECIAALSYAHYLVSWLTDAAQEFGEPSATA
jgi:sarcosine oxidase, subunit gamma